MVRSFDTLQSVGFQQGMREALPHLRRPQGMVFLGTVVLGAVGAASAALPLLEWSMRCTLNTEAPKLGRLACLGSMFGQCRHVLLWRAVGVVCSTVLLYVTAGHLIAYRLIFSYRTGIHLRVMGDDEFEKRRAAQLREMKLKDGRRACRTSITGAASMVDCLEQWQPIALGVLGVCVAVLLFFREPNRCAEHLLLQGRLAPEPLGCCRSTWMDEDSADSRVVAAMVAGLPFAALSWFAFDDAEKIRREWENAPGYEDPIPVDMTGRWPGQEQEAEGAAGGEAAGTGADTLPQVQGMVIGES